MASTPSNHYFIVTMSNFPYLLERTRQYQMVEEVIDPPPAAMPVDDDEVAPHAAAVAEPWLSTLQVPLDAHEQILYDGLVYDLRDAIRAYLQRTARPYPVHMVIDMSDLDI